MTASIMKGNRPVEIKKVSISSKRQVTIPQKFFKMLGFGHEAECIVRGNELVLRPLKEGGGGEFSEQILEELIREGFSGEELLHKFKERQRMVRPAVESLISEAEKAAHGETKSFSYDEVFKMEE